MVREETIAQFGAELMRGAVFYDLNTDQPMKLDVFSASIVDGLGHVLHRRLFVLATAPDGAIQLKQPTIFLDIVPAKDAPTVPTVTGLPDQNRLEQHLVRYALRDFLAEVQAERQREVAVVTRHVELSLNELLNKQNLKLGELIEQEMDAPLPINLVGLKTQIENRIMELSNRLDHRRADLAKEGQCTIASTHHLGTAWLLPHPDRHQPDMQNMVSNADIERIAVQAVIGHENALGYEVQSVESENRGFDLISRRLHPEDPTTAIDVKFIEVKGRAGIGEIALSANEYRTAQRLQHDYYLYVVYDCATNPTVHVIQNPATLNWQAVTRVEQYMAKPNDILHGK